MSIRRQDIVDAVKTRMELIQGSPYHTTIGTNVYVWHPTPVHGNRLPCIIIRDLSDTLLAQNIYDNWDHRLTVAISVMAKGTTSDETVREMIADVLTAIGTDHTWGSKAVLTDFVGDEMLVDQEEDRISGATITIEIQYRTGIWAES
jgi:hypothetical protein